MFQYFAKLKKKSSAAMSETSLSSATDQSLSNESVPATTTISIPSTPGSSLPLTNEEMQAAAASPTSPATPPDQTAIFIEAYDCAKNNHNWNKVSSAVSLHPDWLTRIPTGRRWTMLHQIVYCGNVLHLNEVLAFQISNPEFRLLCKSLDDKTIREVASERAHVHPQMLRCVERLVASDQLLHNAKDGKWELVRQFLRQQPDIINEKPPYRKYYLAHFLALTGQLDIFKDLSNICSFKLDLKADNKTINQIARENNHIEFAEHIEHLFPQIDEVHENTPTPTNNNNQDQAIENHSPNPPYPTSQHFFSQGFYDDPGIMIFSLNPNSFGSMFLSQDETTSYPSHHHHHHNPIHQVASNDLHYATHSLFQGHQPVTTTLSASPSNQHTTNEENHKAKANLPPQMSDEEQTKYETTVMENVKKFPAENLLNAVTCCITKGILRDPVVAADGFTYEREAILNWFEHSNRSPMTNQELPNQELKPNHAIKSILQLLAESDKTEKKSDDKSKKNGDAAK